mmetsp:Transcript_4464/g.13061  ORF Transcript_4464/g.13061 Transcript_4464/m.13061 type:complete len:240 (+) Transcript_4464:817-1536(+)
MWRNGRGASSRPRASRAWRPCVPWTTSCGAWAAPPPTRPRTWRVCLPSSSLHTPRRTRCCCGTSRSASSPPPPTAASEGATGARAWRWVMCTWRGASRAGAGGRRWRAVCKCPNSPPSSSGARVLTLRPKSGHSMAGGTRRRTRPARMPPRQAWARTRHSACACSTSCARAPSPACASSARPTCTRCAGAELRLHRGGARGRASSCCVAMTRSGAPRLWRSRARRNRWAVRRRARTRAP